MLIPLLLLIYILFCLIASRKPSGRATLIVFLLWILTIVATGGLILREYGGEQRHRLHELFDEARDELRDREIDRMQEWVAADTTQISFKTIFHSRRIIRGTKIRISEGKSKPVCVLPSGSI